MKHEPMRAIGVVAADKGGVAKTTTAVNLGWIWAQRGNKVLIVDIDERGDVQRMLSSSTTPRDGFYNYIDGGDQDDNIYRCYEDEHDPNLYYMPGSSKTARLNVQALLEGTQVGDVAGRLQALADEYDVILFDAPRGAQIARSAAMSISDFLVVPTKAEVLGLPETQSLVNKYKQINRRAYWVLPTMVDRRLNEHKTNLAAIKQVFGQNVAIPVPMATEINEAAAHRVPFMATTPRNPSGHEARAAYLALADSIETALS